MMMFTTATLLTLLGMLIGLLGGVAGILWRAASRFAHIDFNIEKLTAAVLPLGDLGERVIRLETSLQDHISAEEKFQSGVDRKMEFLMGRKDH